MLFRTSKHLSAVTHITTDVLSVYESGEFEFPEFDEPTVLPVPGDDIIPTYTKLPGQSSGVPENPILRHSKETPPTDTAKSPEQPVTEKHKRKYPPPSPLARVLLVFSKPLSVCVNVSERQVAATSLSDVISLLQVVPTKGPRAFSQKDFRAYTLIGTEESLVSGDEYSDSHKDLSVLRHMSLPTTLNKSLQPLHKPRPEGLILVKSEWQLFSRTLSRVAVETKEGPTTSIGPEDISEFSPFEVPFKHIPHQPVFPVNSPHSNLPVREKPLIILPPYSKNNPLEPSSDPPAQIVSSSFFRISIPVPTKLLAP